MERLVGVDKLPVVLGSSRLALLIAWQAHLEDHSQDTKIMLSRVRRHAWITKARYPAKAVTQACMQCRRKKNTVAQQVMADLPEFKLSQADPFRACSVDLFGPLT